MPAASAPEAKPGCLQVKSRDALTVEVCNPEPDPAWLSHANVATAILALVVSCVAVYVAHRTLHFARVQDQRNRSSSVRDEFWLRTVISPSSIEPFQKYMNELRAGLPGADPDPPSAQELQKFFAATATALNAFAIKFSALALISDSLPEGVRDELEGMEDAIAEYVAALTAFASTGAGSAPSRTDLQNRLTEGMIRLFRRIQEDQSRDD
jgi:hypothetical protein